MNAISLKDISVQYGAVVAVDSVSLEIPFGSVIGILGPNGSGKTTLIKCMAGALRPSQGKVTCHVDRKELVYVPQRASIDWDFPARVKDVVAQGRYPHLGLLGRFRDIDRKKVTDAMDAMELNDLADRQIGQLSGGQQQRVFLARALAQEGRILLLDEPFQGVDAVSEAALVRALQMFRAENKTAVVIHHDLQTVTAYFDQIAMINKRLVAFGPTSEVFNRENVLATYGGQVALFSKD